MGRPPATGVTFRRLVVAGLLCLATAVLAFAALQRTLAPVSAGVKVRWAPQADGFTRQSAEQRYGLAEGSEGDGRTWAYSLTNLAAANVQALVADPAVEDTAGIDRASFRVTRESTRGRPVRSSAPRASAILPVIAVLAGLAGLAAVGLGLAGLFAPAGPAAAAPRTAARPTLPPLRSRHRALLGLVLGGACALQVASLHRLTMTADEPEHLRYGRNILAGDATRFDDSKMPITALNALPGALAAHLPAGRLSSFLARPETARYATIAFSVLTALVVFAWARRLYGADGALLATALYAFDPNLLAHAALTTTDLYAAGTITLAFYLLWRFLDEGTLRLGVGASLALGLAQIAKYTAVVLYPLGVVAAALYLLPAARRTWHAGRAGGLARGAVQSAGVAAAIVAGSLVVVNVGFLFHQTLTPLDQYSFHSTTLRAVQSALGSLGALPVPAPYPYLEGLDLVMDHERTGMSFGPAYLFGELRPEGFAGYYVWASVYKVPLAIQALVLTAVVVFVWRRPYGRFWQREAMLLVPVVFFAVYFNFFYRAQIGIRYFLVVFPFLYVFAGTLLEEGRPRPRGLTAGLTVAAGALLMSVLSFTPHFLSYTNELVWDRTRAYRVLADSNLDWGQYGRDLEAYRSSHPGTIFEPEAPTPGTILVRVNRLTGVTGDPDSFRWLREHFEPEDHIGHGILVYQLTAADVASLDGR